LGQTKARNVHSYTTINAVAATVSAGEQTRLASNPAVAEVVPDQIIKLSNPFTSTAAGTNAPVAFIADALDINNTDFIRPNGSHVFVDYKDFSGEGLAVPTASLPAATPRAMKIRRRPT
jgi:hypothetical protein